MSVLLWILLLATPPVAEALPPLECVKLVREARLAESGGDVDRAAKLLAEAQEEFPRQVLPLRELLRLYQDHDRSAERVAELHQLFRRRLEDLDYPLAPGTARFLIETASDDRQTLESLRVGLEARLARRPLPEYLEVLAVVQGRLGMYAQERETLGRLIAIEPTFARISEAIRIDLELERWQSVLELLESVRGDERFGSAWEPIYVEMLVRTGRSAEALEEIERLRREQSALTTPLMSSEVLRQIAWNLYDAGDRERSAAVWRLILADEPTDLEAQLVLANLFSSEEERQHREAAVDRQLDEETAPDVLLRMGIEYLTAGDDERAYDLLGRAISSFRENEAAWFNFGLAAMRREQWQETVEAYREAIRLNPDRAASYSHLATGLRMLERYRAAAEAFEKALQLDPDRAVDYYYLSQCYRALGEEDAAARMLREYERRRGD